MRIQLCGRVLYTHTSTIDVCTRYLHHPGLCVSGVGRMSKQTLLANGVVIDYAEGKEEEV